MNRLLRRVRQTTPGEVRVRSLEAVALACERLQFASGGGAWTRRRLLDSLEPDSPPLVDAFEALRSSDWKAAARAARTHFRTRPRRFPIDPSRREDFAEVIRARFPQSATDAAGRARPLLSGQYDLLGYPRLSFGNRIDDVDWHLDPIHQRRAPLVFWKSVRYLDPEIGDHKIIWELNRHQHWLTLGRAAWLTNELPYRARFDIELASWLRGNPPLTGVNWASMLELAFRSMSWLWALHLFSAFDDESDCTWVLDLLVALERQLNHVSRHLSYYFSPNTHLLGEGLALYVAGRALPELKAAARWEALGRAILAREATAQVNADGGHAEGSTHYHRYALDFYLFALTVARASSDADADLFAGTASAMASYCRALASDDGRLPTIGDDDGGMLFPMCGRAPSDVSDSLALAAALLRRSELAVGPVPEEVLWLTGGDVPDLGHAAVGAHPASRLFPQTGYAVIRDAQAHGVVDAGRHGFLNGGHAHADALSLVLTLNGRPLLIDPGTATYTIDAALRDRFRSTAMHNTVVVDGRPQAEPRGPFHWRTQANATVSLWQPHPDCAVIEAEHDGYRPVLHRRTIVVLPRGLWLIADHILGGGEHIADAFWHLDPAWRADNADHGDADHADSRDHGDADHADHSHNRDADHADHSHNRDADHAEHSHKRDADYADHANCMIELVHADGSSAFVSTTARDCVKHLGDDAGLGWCAPVYGLVIPSLTLQFSTHGQAPYSLLTAIAEAPVTLRPEQVGQDGDDGWHRTAAWIENAGARSLVCVATSREPQERTSPDRRPHRVSTDWGELLTDARVAVLDFSGDREPCALHVVDGTRASWRGPGAFDAATVEPARDLQLNQTALRQLSRSLEPRPVG